MPVKPSKNLPRKTSTLSLRRSPRTKRNDIPPDSASPTPQKFSTTSYQKHAEPTTTVFSYLGLRISTTDPSIEIDKPDQRQTERKTCRSAIGRILKSRHSLPFSHDDHLPIRDDTTLSAPQLLAALHPLVYDALVLSPEYDNILRENTFGPHGARFSHQLLLVGGPSRRIPLAGTILAAAGRSAALRYDNLLLRDTFHWRPRLIADLRSSWAEIALTFASLDPPTPRVMALLWSGVYQIMHIRAQRAETWGCPEVQRACAAQLAELPQCEIQSFALLRAIPSDAENLYRNAAAQHQVASFFIPFWSEHILDLGRVSQQRATAWAWELVLQSKPPYVPPPLPDILLRATTPPQPSLTNAEP